MKSVSIRMPEELLEWLTEKAAKEIISRKERVSVNTLVIEILTKEMLADRRDKDAVKLLVDLEKAREKGDKASQQRIRRKLRGRGIRLSAMKGG